LTFKGAGKVKLTFNRSALFELADGGSLQLVNLDISGDDSPDYAGNTVIRTSPFAMLNNYRLEIIDSSVTDLDVNHTFNVIASAKGTFADNILIKNSNYYRGGSDESTFGPHFEMTGSTVDNVGLNRRNKTKSSLYLHGVQVTNVKDNVFKNAAPFLINHTVGEPKTFVTNNQFSGTDAPKVFELNSGLAPTAVIKDNQGLGE